MGTKTNLVAFLMPAMLSKRRSVAQWKWRYAEGLCQSEWPISLSILIPSVLPELDSQSLRGWKADSSLTTPKLKKTFGAPCTQNDISVLHGRFQLDSSVSH